MVKALDMEKVSQYVSDGYISVRDHPTLPLRIYNYTPKAMFDQMWTEETEQCRGLVMDHAGNVVARPFRKFHAFQEHIGPLPDGPYEVWEKVDGSLGILFYHADIGWSIASRGSFTSDQAIKANEMMQEKYMGHVLHLDPSFTYLLEIIYPDNRIVINYGADEKLIMLAAIHTAEGWEMALTGSEWPHRAEFFSTMTSKDNPNDLLLLEQPNKEGFVLRYTGNGLRLKVKFSSYLIAHKILTNTNSKDIWRILSTNGSFEDLLNRVPDEFYNWVKKTRKSLEDQYDKVLQEYLVIFEGRPSTESRKETAEYFKGFDRPDILFAMLEGHDYSKLIWRRLEPKGSVRPFYGNEDEI